MERNLSTIELLLQLGNDRIFFGDLLSHLLVAGGEDLELVEEQRRQQLVLDRFRLTIFVVDRQLGELLGDLFGDQTVLPSSSVFTQPDGEGPAAMPFHADRR